MLLDYSPQILQLSPCHTVYNVKTQVTNTILFQHVMIKIKNNFNIFIFNSCFLHKGYSGQISIECTNICKSKESIFQKGESIHDPYKQTFNIELATDAVSIYVWIEAIGKMDCLQISCFIAMPLR